MYAYTCLFFCEQEDTLTCILALDGFFLENRNIRTSYGTSKYCSAFIKNVRCNNPDCTYLHYMGEPEDNFTKQEIQAGYVTSGRDVLARQQAQMAAAASTNGTTRRRVGGGGPSGTGKVPTNPVFPPPVYEEPVREAKSGSSFVPPPIGTKHGRSVSLGTTIGNTGTATAATGFAAAAAGAIVGGASNSPPITTQDTIGANKVVRQVTQKPATGPSPTTVPTQQAVNLSAGPTAASFVAATAAGSAIQNQQVMQPAPLSTLTPLTPLKRAASLPAKAAGKGSSSYLATAVGNASTAGISSTSQTNSSATISAIGAIGSSRKGSNSSPDLILHSPSNGDSPIRERAGVIGGTTIISSSLGPHVIGSQCSENFTTGLPGLSGMNIGFGTIGTGSDVCWSAAPSSHAGLDSKGTVFGDSAKESGIWGSCAGTSSQISFGSTLDPVGAGGSGGVVGKVSSAPAAVGDNSSAPGGVVIGKSHGSSGGLSKNPFTGDSGTSALASLLGIDLPTGSGSLRESSLQGFLSQGLPPASASAPFSFSSVPIGGLEVGSAVQNRQQPDNMWLGYSSSNTSNSNLPSSSYQPTHIGNPGAIGLFSSANKRLDDGFGGEYSNGIGGVPIGTSIGNSTTAGGLLIGGSSAVGHDRSHSTSNDIALLQSLLPGVRRTSGNHAAPLSSSDVVDGACLGGWGGAFGSDRDSVIGCALRESNVVGKGRSAALESTGSWASNPTFLGAGERDAQQGGRSIW